MSTCHTIVTTRKTWTTTQVCSCGQDLDGIEREHCPRCGCEVARAA